MPAYGLRTLQAETLVEYCVESPNRGDTPWASCARNISMAT